MELEMIRSYFDEGCNGEIYHEGQRLCYTIELPWKGNRKRVSCIPEGRYQLHKRYSPRHRWHLLVAGVPGRSFILVHPANDAARELHGCIAPVSQLTAAGCGQQSREAQERLKRRVFPALEKEPVFITIKSNHHETD
jgi:hypothetical protein